MLPILWSLGSLWVAHKSKNKLTIALFLKINEKTHTVICRSAVRLARRGYHELSTKHPGENYLLHTLKIFSDLQGREIIMYIFFPGYDPSLVTTGETEWMGRAGFSASTATLHCHCLVFCVKLNKSVIGRHLALSLF